MLKKKLSIVSIIVLLVLSLTLPIVKADNETTNVSVEPISENTSQDNNTTTDVQNTDANQDANAQNNFKEGDVYIYQNDVTIDYVIDGNLFIFGNNVTINSQVGGDAFICGNNITVGERGYVFSNLFALTNSLTIKGVVYDVYAIADNITVDGYVYRDLRTYSKDLTINGTVGRNAYVSCSNISFSQQTPSEDGTSAVTSNGTIAGSLNYSSSKELSIPEGSVTGEIKFTQEEQNNTKTISSYLVSLGSFIVLVIIIWLLSLWIAPKFLNKTSSLVSSKKILPVIGLGILSPIIIAVISVLLLLLSITAGVGLLLLSILIILACISTSITIISINNCICKKLNVTKNTGILGFLIITTIILWAICLIPYVGSILRVIFIILGMGIISYSLLTKNKTEITSEKKTKEAKTKKVKDSKKVKDAKKEDKNK